MARLIDEGMIAQLSKKQGYFLKYFPARIRNVGEDAKEDRKLIYAFKDARDDAYKLVAQMVDGYLKREYGEQVKDMVFLCVPASRQEVNKSRYKEFCKEVSRLRTFLLLPPLGWRYGILPTVVLAGTLLSTSRVRWLWHISWCRIPYGRKSPVWRLSSLARFVR